jgi:hypothetical protein
LDERLYAGVALAEGDKSQQDHNGVGQQMMRLETIVVHEVPEKVTDRQSESSLKV